MTTDQDLLIAVHAILGVDRKLNSRDPSELRRIAESLHQQHPHRTSDEIEERIKSILRNKR
ncbi:hypothetical protein [Rhizobium sp. WYCCWR 11128]|uniref:hypothetical protein n=1 Tax=Rhizobium sp. WYCCWR 11128 TaxID=2749832 RepID=UPI0015D3DCC4|nr:hypothetical protein [Rhizobium sp. WYCCWR 11128]NYT35015.1 hypothetical protein [Rhizobium sp. WYCCWR 11128]